MNSKFNIEANEVSDQMHKEIFRSLIAYLEEVRRMCAEERNSKNKDGGEI